MEILQTILRYILIYLVIISGSIFIADKANKKIEKCIAPNICIIILALYIFGIANILKYAVWIISIINIILGLYTIIKNRKNIKKKIITPGFIFFSVVFFILIITSYSKNLVDYDHYLYRSFNTKVMYYTDCINKGFGALYPPSINLLEYFFMKIIGTYVQGIEAFAVQIFGFSLLIPLFDRAKNTRFLNWIITIAIVCLPAILPNLIFYESAYPDALLGLVIGYSMYIYYSEKENSFKTFLLTLIFAVTTITKTSGFVISGIIIGIYGLIELLDNKCNKKEKIIKFFKSKEFKTISILTITVIITFLSWRIFVKANKVYTTGERGTNVARVGESSILYIIKGILTTTFGYYEENHVVADSNNSLIPKIYSIYTTISPVRMTAYGVIAVIMIASIIIYKYIVKQENKRKFANYIIALTVGLAVYIIFLQLSYILKFSTEEMLGHNGLNRYLPTFLLGMIYFLVAIAIKNMEEKKDRKVNYIMLIAIILSFTQLQSIANVSITSGIYNIQSVEYCNNGRIPARKINEKIEETARVLSISTQSETNIYNLMIKYYLYPDHAVDIYNSLTEKSVENIKKRLLRNDEIYYMYFVSINDKINELINKQFRNDIKLKASTLYTIQIKENSIELKEETLD